MFEANAGPAPAVHCRDDDRVRPHRDARNRHRAPTGPPAGAGRELAPRVVRGTERKRKHVAYPFVEDAIGKLTYTADGHVGARSSEELIGGSLVHGDVPDRPEGRTIHHHVQHGSIAQWEGGDQPRAFKLSGRRLTLSVRPTEPGGTTAVLKWRKSVRSRLAPVLRVRGKWANTNSRFSVEERASRTRS
jgi:hypothetical protein